jgi:hypothetical protein
MNRRQKPDISWPRFIAVFAAIVILMALAIKALDEYIIKPAEEYNQRTITKHN